MNTSTVLALLPFAFFCIFLVLEAWFPRRAVPQIWTQARFAHNLALFVINALVARLLLPLSLLVVASGAEQAHFGLFNLMELPTWVEVALAVILLDLAIYGQHVATHKIPVLWRLHKVHHADRAMDVSTAVRFHPLELVLSSVFKALVVLALGASSLAVAVFVLLLFIGPTFNHSNLRVPHALDRVLRWVIATPDVHRAHHSVFRAEQDTNYGFFLIWWDKLFGTYTAEPRGGHIDMLIGLPRDKEAEQASVGQMLIAPFR